MRLQSSRELENTRCKLRELEAEYEATASRRIENPRVREAALTSLRRLIKQFKEEIARYESHQPPRAEHRPARNEAHPPARDQGHRPAHDKGPRS